MKSKYAQRVKLPFWRKADKEYKCFNCGKTIKEGEDVLIFQGMKITDELFGDSVTPRDYACGECGDEERPRQRGYDIIL